MASGSPPTSRSRLPQLDRETAETLVAQAHQVCPYSNATRDNMQVTLAVA